MRSLAQSGLLTLCSGTECCCPPVGLGSSDPTTQMTVRTHPVRVSGLAITQLALDSLTAPLPPGTMKSGEMTTS